jgi:hypothetical protein
MLTAQAFTCIIAYSVASVSLFLPSLSYSEYSFSRRLKWMIAILVIGSVIALSLNCMVVGYCLEWSWTIVILVSLIPSFLTVMFVFFPQDMKDLRERMEKVIYE